MQTSELTLQHRLMYAGLLAGCLCRANIKVKPIIGEDGIYTAELDIEARDGVHIIINITGTYHDPLEEINNADS